MTTTDPTHPDASTSAQNPGAPHAEPPVHQPSRRSLRTMAIVRWLLLALVTLVAAYTTWTYWGPQSHEHAGHREARYYCPMHPEIRSPDPGECPICHMTLEPIPEDRRGAASGAGAEPAPPNAPGGTTVVTLSEEKQRSVGLATSLVESTNLGDRLRVPGVITAPETGLAQVRVRAPGFVEQVAVRQTGVKVSRGQPLAYIFSPDIYRAQEEYLAASRWSAGGTQPGSAAPGAADIAGAARRALELLGMTAADIDGITKTGKPLRAIAVRAPAAGVITSYSALLGSRADPEMVLYEIADLSSVWVIASLHEHDVNAMKVGMEAKFSVTNSQDEPLTGRVELIEPILEEATRTTRVRIVIPNQDGRLRPGQFGEIEFALSGSLGLSVPRDAVIRTGEHEYVYVATGTERFEPRLVKTGLAREGRVQVLSGLVEGDRVVTRGSFMLDSESRLKASLAAAPTPSGGKASASPSPNPPGHVH